jgi:hypothetical protein
LARNSNSKISSSMSSISARSEQNMNGCFIILRIVWIVLAEMNNAKFGVGPMNEA